MRKPFRHYRSKLLKSHPATFADLQFSDPEPYRQQSWASLRFANGFGVSVTRRPVRVHDCNAPNGVAFSDELDYELAVRHKEYLCYRTCITSDVIRTDPEEITEIMQRVQKLPAMSFCVHSRNWS